jgi:hypothetical protein
MLYYKLLPAIVLMCRAPVDNHQAEVKKGFLISYENEFCCILLGRGPQIMQSTKSRAQLIHNSLALHRQSCFRSAESSVRGRLFDTKVIFLNV